ncbi:MAG: 2-oxoglutarate dehydrogenase complex dihydrolipoyllysine-residue succinyltransferase [Flavobacteriaceae bacterium]|nr:2-oxoglutarate dehydrogenase complex dihydrolipoyllysine-residue succinyltransferase [Flavobacteriaceae bacterium]
MEIQIKAPSPGESVSEVEIAQLLVNNGDLVKKNQLIAELDSDKATLELYSENSGAITFLVSEGDIINVGDVVATINTSVVSDNDQQNKDTDKTELITENTQASSSLSNQSNPSSQLDFNKPLSSNRPDVRSEDWKNPLSTNYTSAVVQKVNIPSPAAKKILAEKGIHASEVNGTGRNGRITKEDALRAVHSMGTPPQGIKRTSNRKKLSSLRRKVAQRLVAVKNQTAMLTTFNEVNMQPIFDLRSTYKEIFLEKHGVKLGFMSFFTKAVVRALKEFPEVNSMIDGDQQIIYDYHDISIAVSGPRGLMVPVVRNAETLSFPQIEQEIVRLATKARDGKLTIDEMTGGTFTITNGGVFGSMLSTPIINPPQSAILGMHNIIPRPIAVENQVVIKPMMYLAVSYDHRIIDGRESVGFLVAIKEGLEKPEELLMVGNQKEALGL